MIDQASFKAGRLTFDIPARCPNKAMFESVVREELKEHFGNNTNRAAFCKGEYDRCRDVPPDFRQNIEAQRHYQKAQMALSPGAQQWDRFADAVFNRFLGTHGRWRRTDAANSRLVHGRAAKHHRSRSVAS